MLQSQGFPELYLDAPYLFLGASFVTCGFIAAAIPIIRRKYDPLFVWIAVFALLDGGRLWLQSDIPWGAEAPSPIFERIRWAIDFLTAIPIFLFLQATDFLNHFLRVWAWIAGILCLLLFIGTLAIGHSPVFRLIFDFAMAASVAVFLIWFRAGKDSRIVRVALLIYVTASGIAYVAAISGFHWRIEPWACALLLGGLGYAATSHALARDHELHDLEMELTMARRIQRSILSTDVPASTSFNVVTRYVPMTAVAGDFYEVVAMDDRQAGLFIADVSGHGVPAALIASMVKLAVDSQRALFACPGELLSGINALLCRNARSQLVTAAYAYLNCESNQLLYSAAGHPPMLLWRRGEVIALEENGLLMAAFPFATYSATAVNLEARDRILLYTDGVLEAANSDDIEFGPDRLSAILNKSETHSISEVADLIVSEVSAWSNTQGDDITVLLCEYKGL
jgi:phosphoserine phosphatase RsbU/P